MMTGALALIMPEATRQATASWTAQIILGNTTHIILTFLLLGLRPDVLRATKNQAKAVGIGSIVAFAVTWAIYWSVDRYAPRWNTFPIAVLAVFGTQHRLAQAKGIWALYNLRAASLGMPAPHARERSLQQVWVSLGLLLVMISWLFVPSAAGRMFPLFQAIPAEPAFLPRQVAFVLAAIWVLFVFTVLVTINRSRSNLPKLAHIATHGAAVTVAIVSPAWGIIVWGAIHGLEYIFLSARMLEPREGDVVKSPRHWMIWPLMAVAMAPIAFLSLGGAPFAAGLFATGSWTLEGIRVVNSVTAAHYFADGVIFRFRIPEVRKAVLHRLAFAR